LTQRYIENPEVPLSIEEKLFYESRVAISEVTLKNKIKGQRNYLNGEFSQDAVLSKKSNITTDLKQPQAEES
jgi:hypothetical protein